MDLSGEQDAAQLFKRTDHGGRTGGFEFLAAAEAEREADAVQTARACALDIVEAVADEDSGFEVGHAERVERLLHEITDELSSGNINADPCSRSPQESSCDWCEYASACCFEEGHDRRRMMKKVRDSEFWRFIEQETEEVRHG